MKKEAIHYIESRKERLKKIDFGDTVICITLDFVSQRKVYKEILYLCAIEPVGGSSYNSKYYRAKVLLTEKEYKVESTNCFAIHTNKKNAI